MRAKFEFAVVTGASSGIGAALARQLVAAGTRELLLVARRRERLEALASELERAGATEVAIEVADLTLAEDVRRIAARVANRPPDLLVNNAGSGLYGPFVALDREAQLAMIDLNVRALVALSHAYVAAVLPRGHGALLQVASTAGIAPIPYEAVYAASKSFVVNFSEALAEELRGTRLQIVTLCPGFTETEFLAAAGLPDNVVLQRGTTAAAVAKTALAALARSGSRTIVHGKATRIAGTLGRIAPRAWVVRGIGAWMRRGQARGAAR